MTPLVKIPLLHYEWFTLSRAISEAVGVICVYSMRCLNGKNFTTRGHGITDINSHVLIESIGLAKSLVLLFASKLCFETNIDYFGAQSGGVYTLTRN